jgi:ABC-type Fe3+/spermidine/putrescine transport system ATPase subunit
VSLRLESVQKSYPEFTIRLNLEARRGELLTLLGPSGCGKTTSLRLVAGFLHPEAGRIFIAGKSVEGQPPHRRRIGIVFQDYALFPNLNVLDNVCFGPAVQGWERGRARARGRELLEIVHLAGYEKRKVHTLSGGERQRVALARALAPRPRLLLLDEPLSALDARLRRSLRLEIQAVQRELGVTAVYVTHDQEEALAISDRIAVMREGSIEQVGSPEEVYRRPAGLFVAGFIGQANLVPGTVTAVRNGLAVLDTPLGKLSAPAGAPARASAHAPPPAAGERRVLFFRPEAARLETAAERGGAGGRAGRGSSAGPGAKPGNHFRGRVLSQEYLGALVETRVEAGGHRLVLSLPPGAAAPGQAIRFTVDPRDCWLLPEAGAPAEAQPEGRPAEG